MTKRRQKRPSSRAPKKPIPTFATEDAERDFWNSVDSTDYVDWGRAKGVRLPELKPSTATISLRLPEGLLEELKVLANERDVPYQSLLKVFLAERIRQEKLRRRSA
jgi:predicted DNA binding CopG/RHH family protein